MDVVEKLIQKHDQLCKTLLTLEKAVTVYQIFIKQHQAYNPFMTYEEECCALRDSLIQCFEYSIDIFWKYLKKYLESVHVLMNIKIPGEVIRVAMSVGILTSQEAELKVEMIKSRNMTSHIYVEEIANFFIILLFSGGNKLILFSVFNG